MEHKENKNDFDFDGLIIWTETTEEINLINEDWNFADWIISFWEEITGTQNEVKEEVKEIQEPKLELEEVDLFSWFNSVKEEESEIKLELTNNESEEKTDSNEEFNLFWNIEAKEENQTIDLFGNTEEKQEEKEVDFFENTEIKEETSVDLFTNIETEKEEEIKSSKDTELFTNTTSESQEILTWDFPETSKIEEVSQEEIILPETKEISTVLTREDIINEAISKSEVRKTIIFKTKDVENTKISELNEEISKLNEEIASRKKLITEFKTKIKNLDKEELAINKDIEAFNTILKAA